jgi:pancreatic triacylglycerol lipase
VHLVDLNPFETSVEPLFNAESDVIFLLYTRQNPTVGQRINLRDLNSLRNSNFNAAHPTRITIHGWRGGPNSTVNRHVNFQYFLIGDYNVSKGGKCWTKC